MASQQEKIGSYAFLAGAVIAIISGVLSGAGQTGALGGVESWIPLVLILLGLVVGFLNVKDKEVHTFLIASISLLVLAGTAGGLIKVDDIFSPLGSILAGMVQNLAVFVAPAALLVALKAIKSLASEQAA